MRKRLLPNFAPVRLAWLASCGGLEGNGAEIPEISLSLAIVLAPMYTSLPVLLCNANTVFWVICQLPSPSGLVSMTLWVDVSAG